MSDRPADAPANIPDATAQVSQEHGGETPPATKGGDGTLGWCVGTGVMRAARVKPYDRRAFDPIYRPLRIFSLDPSQSRLEGAIAVVDVPFEPLMPGPRGRLFEVDTLDHARNVRYAPVDLDARDVLITRGREPSPADAQFHQQMVYAVCSSVYAAFKAALGRNLAWGFGAAPGEAGVPEDTKDPAFPLRLKLVPHAMWEKNAYYSPAGGEIRFGYYRAREDSDAKNPPGGYVFTCLSHDIIVHEFTHALLHGLRGLYLIPTRPDVLAFHEGFGDLVAIFQHFAYREVVAAAIATCGPGIDHAAVLGELARQFGYTTSADAAHKAPLRSAIDVSLSDQRPQQQYDSKLEMHALGSVLVSAVFEAFVTLFRRKTVRYIRLATNGSGVLGAGALPHDLQLLLADEASELASQILNLCIRAIDYCPPVDIEFGDYLRAVITADAELVADDPWAYREALVNAFGRRGIYPSGVGNLSEDSLRWRGPWRPIKIPELHFAELRFSGDPALAARAGDLRKQADALGHVATDESYFEAFGLARPDEREYGVPCVQSIRTARRVGPDGQVLFDVVAEITQERRITAPDGSPTTLPGGATVIVDPEGSVRYAIVKNVASPDRLEQFQTYLAGTGRSFRLAPQEELFRLVHQKSETPPG